MTTVSEIIRCTIQDLGSRQAAARYCQRIARAGGSFAAEYAEAADYLTRTTPAYYVLNEHTLGYVYSPQPNVFGVLAADIHGYNNPLSGVVILTLTDTLRAATLEDFRRFRVDPTGHLEGIRRAEHGDIYPTNQCPHCQTTHDLNATSQQGTKRP